MTPDRWREIDRVWHAVLSRPEHERAAAVADLCSGDETLRGEVESLLTHVAQATAAGFGAAAATARGSLLGRHLGSYVVRRLLGAGGMGEVYQAHDATLGRDVALKIIPDPWLADPDRRARFEREARLLASLNHPNIGAIYGVHESDGVRVLVLELVEGETLAQLIAEQARHATPPRGLPIGEVMRIAVQMADALEAAHERGVVHRDLKPANIKITSEARVKVLDFGLARAVSGAGAELAHSPTMTVGSTNTGALIGTAPYMSPEQARGRTADRSTDIWAFGCVLYEMLSGTPAFTGDDVAEVLANVIKGEPDWRALPADTPPVLRVCLTRCLQKDLRQRFHDIADVRLAMEGAFEAPAGQLDSNRVTSWSHAGVTYGGWAAAALVMVAGGLGILASVGRVPAELPETRLELVTPPADDPFSLAIAPDGRSVVFQARGQQGSQLWLRRLEAAEAQPLPGTENGIMPFWSPDSRSIGFFADSTLKRIDVAGGGVRALASTPAQRGGAWGEDGTILFAAYVGPLYRVPAEGGAVEAATTLLPGQSGHRWPQFLPGGRRFLLMTLGESDVRGIYLGALSDPTVRRVSDRDSAYEFMPPGYMLLARHGALWARKLDEPSMSGEGPLLPVAARVLVHLEATGFGAFSASSAGAVAYRASGRRTQLVWLDREGRPSSAQGTPDDTQTVLAHLSPDGRTAGVQRVVDGNTDVWLIDTDRGVPRRLTTDPGIDGWPVFAPDGTRVAYVRDGKADVYQMYERAADGTGDETLLLESDGNQNPQDWSPDGRYILYRDADRANLWALPLFGERRPFEVVQVPFVPLGARFSPDGRWVAYALTETGRAEVYVQPFPGPGRKSQVSVGGGTHPRWRRDGRELFYRAPDNRLMAVSIVSRGAIFEAAPPRSLFTLPGAPLDGYEPSPDGQRFLVSLVSSEASPISIILNWKPPGR
jgi:eukaryotic-like serine/threonine-protein kinase